MAARRVQSESPLPAFTKSILVKSSFICSRSSRTDDTTNIVPQRIHYGDDQITIRWYTNREEPSFTTDFPNRQWIDNRPAPDSDRVHEIDTMFTEIRETLRFVPFELHDDG